MRDGATNRLVARFGVNRVVPRRLHVLRGDRDRARGRLGGHSSGRGRLGSASKPSAGQAIQVDLGTHRFGEPAERTTRRGSRLGRRAERGRARARTQRPSDRSVRVRRRCERHGRAPRPAHRRCFVGATRAFTDAGTRGRRDARRHDARPGRNRLRPRVGGRAGRTPLVRRFDSSGRSLGSTETAESRSSQIRHGLGWSRRPSAAFPTVDAGRGRRIARRARRSTPGRSRGPIARRRNRSHRARPQQRDSCRSRRFGRVHRSWRITSETKLAEVQLAEPLGNHLRARHTRLLDDRDQFVVLVLDRSGVRRTLHSSQPNGPRAHHLRAFAWSASSLFQLGSTSAGVFVIASTWR